MKKFLKYLLICLALIGLVSCSNPSIENQPATNSISASAQSNKTVESLTIAITKDENTLSPFTYVSGTGLTANRLIYDTLFTTDLNNNIIPWMVEDNFKIVDSKEYTITLKNGLKFHNDNPVTAEDVKFSFEYPVKQKVASQRKICNKIASIDIINDRTIKFTLKQKDINFLRDGLAYIRILNKAIYSGSDDGSKIKETIGSGPYKLIEYKTGEYYKLKAVDNYFAGNIRVKNINMPIMSDKTAIQQAILAGKLAASTGSIGTEMVDTFTAIDGLQVLSNAGYAPMIINFNNGRAPFDKVEFRQALSYAIDVKGIAKALFGNHVLVGTKGLIRSDLPYAVPNLEYTYNTAKANDLLESLGFHKANGSNFRLNSNGKPLSIEIITYSGNASRTRACELIKEQLKLVGIDVVIKAMDMDTADTYIWPKFDVSAGRNYDMSTWGWSNTSSLTYLISLCSSDFSQGTFNVCGYNSKNFDTVVANKLSKVTNMDEMTELLKDLQNIVGEEIPMLTIGFPDTLQVCNTKMYDGWKAGAGSNVINIFTFLDK